jgi:hypothetical protein
MDPQVINPCLTFLQLLMLSYLEGRAPKLWTKVDRMYKYKQKGNEDQNTTNTNYSDK